MVVTIEHRRAKDRERQARRLSRLSPEERRQRWRHYQQEHRARVKVAEKAPAPLPACEPPPPPATDDEILTFDAEMAALCLDEASATSEPEPPADDAPAISEPEPPADEAPEPDDEFLARLQGVIDEAVAEQRSVTLDDLDGRSERERMHVHMESWRDSNGI